jgi:1-acyl-sn-glycerol-3-phosphate acyltransferase
MAIWQRRGHERLVLQRGGEARSEEPPEPTAHRQRLGARSWTLYHLGRSILKTYAWARIDMDVERRAPLPDGPKILAANHPTTTDPFYILTLLSEPVSVLVTASAFSVRGFGWYLRRSGHVPAVRGSNGTTVDAVVRKVLDGCNVAIFPEGALSPLGGGFHRPHSGVARVALRTGAPVIPVGIGLLRDRIRVSEVDLPQGAETGHLYMSGRYCMTVGRPVYCEGDPEDRDRVCAVAEDIMRRIRRLAGESERRAVRPVVGIPRNQAEFVRIR